MTHVPALDGIRGVAILAVMLSHSALLPGGWLGVDVFFVLSGFLITSLLVAERGRSGRISLSRFYLRRGLRLLPALVVMAGLVSLALWWEGYPLAGRELAAVLLYVGNYAWLWWQGLPLLYHCWSLAIEEQYYLVWPAVLLLLFRLPRPVTLGVTVAGAFGIAAYRTYLVYVAKAPVYGVVWLTLPARGDGLLIGSALALAVAWGWVRPSARLGWPAAGALALLVAFAGNPRAYHLHGASLHASLATAALIVVALSPCAISRALAWRPLAYLGRISYGVYLWHLPVFALAGVLSFAVEGGATWRAPWWQIALGWALTLTVAASSYRWLETPFLRLKDQFAWQASSEPPDARQHCFTARTSAFQSASATARQG